MYIIAIYYHLFIHMNFFFSFTYLHHYLHLYHLRKERKPINKSIHQPNMQIKEKKKIIIFFPNTNKYTSHHLAIHSLPPTKHILCSSSHPKEDPSQRGREGRRHFHRHTNAHKFAQHVSAMTGFRLS